MRQRSARSGLARNSRPTATRSPRSSSRIDSTTGEVGDVAEAGVEHDRAAEAGPQVGDDRAARVGQDAEVGQAEVLDAVEQRLVGRGGERLVLLEHALDVVGGRDADADLVGADRLGHGTGHLDREAGVRGRRAAVRVGAGVGGLAEELVDQVAVGRVHLDAVETGLDRVAGGGDELLDDAGDLVGLERARGRHVDLAVGGDHLAVGGQGARGDGLEAALVVGVRDPADVHQLGDDVAASGVDGVGDLAPAGELLGGVEAGGVEVALADRAGLRALGDDQPGAGALAVVLGVEVAGDGALRAVAGQGRHHEALRQLPAADDDRFECGGHGGDLSSKTC